MDEAIGLLMVSSCFESSFHLLHEPSVGSVCTHFLLLHHLLHIQLDHHTLES